MRTRIKWGVGVVALVGPMLVLFFVPSDRAMPIWGYLTGLTVAVLVADAAGRQRFRPTLLLRTILAGVFFVAAVPWTVIVGYIVGVCVVLALGLILGPDAITRA